jgi:RNA polymerase sigma-70 factor (ECF subfamily)
LKSTAAALVVEHAPFVWRVLTHLGVPRHRLEDACQEVFLIVLDKLSTFEARSTLKSWLYGICRNVAHTERRRDRTHTEIPTAELPESVVQPVQEGEVWIKQAHARLIHALSLLDEDQRQVFVLFEIEELSMEEIAASMRVPLRTCYSRLTTARAKVHAELRRRALPNQHREELSI